MNQQRSRRFRSAQEAKEKEDETAQLIEEMEKRQGSSFDDVLKNKKVWDSNAITPGTPFMDILAASLKYWIAKKLNDDPAWAKVSHLDYHVNSDKRNPSWDGRVSYSGGCGRKIIKYSGGSLKARKKPFLLTPDRPIAPVARLAPSARFALISPVAIC